MGCPTSPKNCITWQKKILPIFLLLFGTWALQPVRVLGGQVPVHWYQHLGCKWCVSGDITAAASTCRPEVNQHHDAGSAGEGKWWKYIFLLFNFIQLGAIFKFLWGELHIPFNFYWLWCREMCIRTAVILLHLLTFTAQWGSWGCFSKVGVSEMGLPTIKSILQY